MFSLKCWTVTSDACTDLHANEQNRERARQSKWIWMKGKSIRNTPPLNTPSFVPLLHSVIFYSLTRCEFNKYMQMCAVEHDECKSGEDVLWARLRLRLRADPWVNHFSLPYRIQFCHFCAWACVCMCLCTYVWNFIQTIRVSLLSAKCNCCKFAKH